MNPYALKSLHTRNLDTYTLAFDGAVDAEVAMLARLVEMELTLVAEADDLILQLQQLRAEQHACSAESPVDVRQPAFYPAVFRRA